MRGVMGIVLAAGESRRMGSPKALLVWRGLTFLDHVKASLDAAGIEEICVIVGRWAEGRPAPPGYGLVLENPHPEGGPISSIRIALTAPKTTADIAVVTQVDHPAVRSETVKRLVELARSMPANVVIPTHDGRGGHPVVLPKELFPAILDPKTPTLRDAIAAYAPERLHRWACGDPGVLVDVDTPEDLERLIGSSA